MKTSMVSISSAMLTASVVLVLFSGCSKSNPTPATEMLVNGNMETTSAWFNANLSSSISPGFTNEASASPSRSVKISQTAVSNSSDFGSCGQTYSGTIPTGKDLTFSVKIKGNNLAGAGAAIAIRTDGATSPDLQFITTQGTTSITGTFDWTIYSVKLTNVSSSAKYIDVYMMLLPNTTGTVYYDDASLTHN